MKSPIFILFALIFLLAGCGQNSTTESENAQEGDQMEQDTGWPRTEIGNFEYLHHIKNDGPKPQPGNIVQYNYQLKQGTILMTDNLGKDPVGARFPKDEEARSTPNPITEALRLMSVGDSLTLIYRFSTEPGGYYHYDFKVVNILEIDMDAIPTYQSDEEIPPGNKSQ